MDDSDENKWYVVNYLDDDTVEVIPQKWYITSLDKAYWPNSKEVKISEAVRKCYSPNNWPTYNANILGTYDNFEEAAKKVVKAKCTDHLSSTDNSQLGLGKRKRFKKRLYSDTSDSDEPNPPTSRYTKVKNYTMDETRNSEVLPTTSSATKDYVQRIQCSQIIASSATHKESIDFDALPSTREEENKEKHETLTKNYEQKEFQRTVLRQLFLINAKLREHSENFQILINERVTKQTNQKNKSKVVSYNMPFNKNDYNIVEELLLVEEDRLYFSQYLSIIGGKDVKNITKKILSKILSNEVAVEYNWEGTKGKKCFKNTNISLVVINAVRLNKLAHAATDDEIITCIKGFLVKAKQRLAANKHVI